LNYDEAGSFKDGVARIKLNGWWGIIDKDGKGITPIKYDSIKNTMSGLLQVSLNKKQGFLSASGLEYFED